MLPSLIRILVLGLVVAQYRERNVLTIISSDVQDFTYLLRTGEVETGTDCTYMVNDN